MPWEMHFYPLEADIPTKARGGMGQINIQKFWDLGESFFDFTTLRILPKNIYGQI